MDSFYVTVFSNACTNKYQQNTLTSFKNDLPISYTLKPRDNWCIALKSIGFLNNFKNIKLPETFTPSIYIYLDVC